MGRFEQNCFTHLGGVLLTPPQLKGTESYHTFILLLIHRTVHLYHGLKLTENWYQCFKQNEGFF